MVHFNQEKLDNLHNIFKINLINSCSGYKPANLIATISNKGIENVAIFSSVVHIGSNPPLLGFIVRPSGDVARNTYNNIKETQFYTINHVFESITEDAHHTSARYDENISEFDATNLETEYKNKISTPFVTGSPVQIQMKYVSEYYIKENNTTLVLGKIVNLFIIDEIIDKDGYLNLAKANVATVTGLDGYSIPKLKDRKGYQRPKANILIKKKC
ncbi:flavin reductase [Flavobacteriaceae bacterium]|nr:flavin reductase [Flavobacteriaceae bacterium]MDB9712865.1 flavin reductase [Flavobacteriaceae bacterium]MDC1492279.1 flavin reductase [Flavobacteriaceae bacterium]